MKYRIIESNDGYYYPQCKSWLFGEWKLLYKNADTGSDELWILESYMITKDPIEAARFDRSGEAESFINRVIAKIEAYWSEKYSRLEREAQGISIRRVISQKP
jgi:hypothetical protein